MKKRFYLFIFLPFILGMSAAIPQINWRGIADSVCFSKCEKNKSSCITSCDVGSFFHTNPYIILDCFDRCNTDYYFCEQICRYQSQEP